MLRKKLAVLLAAVTMLMVMAVPAYSATCTNTVTGEQFQCAAGNKLDDGADPNEGGGQEHIRNGHPPKAGGEQHGGGDGDNGGGND